MGNFFRILFIVVSGHAASLLSETAFSGAITDAICQDAWRREIFVKPEGGKPLPETQIALGIRKKFRHLMHRIVKPSLIGSTSGGPAPLGSWILDFQTPSVATWDASVDEFYSGRYTNMDQVEEKLGGDMMNFITVQEPNELVIPNLEKLFGDNASTNTATKSHELLKIFNRAATSEIKLRLIFTTLTNIKFDVAKVFADTWLGSYQSEGDDAVEYLFDEYGEIMSHNEHRMSEWKAFEMRLPQTGTFIHLPLDSGGADEALRPLLVHVGYTIDEQAEDRSLEYNYHEIISPLVLIQLATQERLRSKILDKILQKYAETNPQQLGKWVSMLLMILRPDLVQDDAADQTLREKILEGYRHGFTNPSPLEEACHLFLAMQLSSNLTPQQSISLFLQGGTSTEPLTLKLMSKISESRVVNDASDLDALKTFFLAYAIDERGHSLEDVFEGLRPLLKHLSPRESLLLMRKFAGDVKKTNAIAAGFFESAYLHNTAIVEFMYWTKDEEAFLAGAQGNGKSETLRAYAKTMIALAAEKTDADLLALIALWQRNPDTRSMAEVAFMMWILETHSAARLLQLPTLNDTLDLEVLRNLHGLVAAKVIPMTDLWGTVDGHASAESLQNDFALVSNWINAASQEQLSAPVESTRTLKIYLHETLRMNSFEEQTKIMQRLGAFAVSQAEEILAAKPGTNLSAAAWDALNAVAILHSYENIPNIRTRQINEIAQHGRTLGHPACLAYVKPPKVKEVRTSSNEQTNAVIESPLAFALNNNLLDRVVDEFQSGRALVEKLTLDDLHKILEILIRDGAFTDSASPASQRFLQRLATDSSLERITALIYSRNAMFAKAGIRLLGLKGATSSDKLTTILVDRFDRHSGENRPTHRAALRDIFFDRLKKCRQTCDMQTFEDYFRALKSLDFFTDVIVAGKLNGLLTWTRLARGEQRKRLISYLAEQVAWRDQTYEATRLKIMTAYLNVPVLMDRAVLASLLISDPNVQSPLIQETIERALSYNDQLDPVSKAMLQTALQDVAQRGPAQFAEHNFAAMHEHFTYHHAFLEGNVDSELERLKAKSIALTHEGAPLDERLDAIEEYAVAYVMRAELAAGRLPTDVGRKTKLGYDIWSYDPKTGEVRFIEVKGKTKRDNLSFVSNNETKVAQQKPGRYYLYIIDLFINSGASEARHYRDIDWVVMKALYSGPTKESGRYYNRDGFKPYELVE